METGIRNVLLLLFLVIGSHVMATEMMGSLSRNISSQDYKPGDGMKIIFIRILVIQIFNFIIFGIL